MNLVENENSNFLILNEEIGYIFYSLIVQINKMIKSYESIIVIKAVEK